MASINVLLSLTDRFTSPLRSVANTTRQVQRQIGSANNTLSRFGEGIGSRISGITSAIGSLASAMGVLSVGAYALDAVNTYKDFDQSMHNLAATAGITASETNEAYASMMAKARELGATTTKTASEAANAMNYMCLAGWNTEDVLANVGGVLKLSEATGMDLAAASDAVTDSMAALGLTANDTGKYLDVVAKAQQKSNQGAAQLLEAYKGVGGLMNNLKVPIEESATALGVLANRGIKGAEGGTALNAILANLTTGAGQAGKAMAGLGISAFNSDGSFKGIQATLMELQGKLAGMTDEEKNATLAAIGGKEHVDALNDLMAGLTTTVADGRTEWNALTDDLKSASGALDGMADTQRDTLQGAMDGFRSALEDTQITLVSAFAPALKDILNTMSSSVLPAFGNEMKYFGEAILPNIVSGLSALAPIIAGVAAGFAAFAIMTEIVEVMATLGTVIEGVAAAGGVLNFVLAMNPLVLYAAGIGAAVAAVILLWRNCEGFRNVVTKMGESLKNVFGNAVTKIGSVFDNVSAKVSAAVERLQSAIDSIVSVLSPVVGFIADVFGTELMMYFDVFTGALSGVLNGIDSVVSGIMDIFGGLVTFVGGLFTGDLSQMFSGLQQVGQGLYDGTLGAVGEVFNGLYEGVEAGATRIVDFLKEKFGPIVEVVETALSPVKDIFGNLFDGVSNEITTPVADALSNAAEPVGNMLNSASDSISGKIEAITSKFDTLKTSIGDKLAPVFEGVGGKVSEFAGKIADIGGAISEKVMPIAETVSGVFNSITEGISAGIDTVTQLIGDTLDNVIDNIIQGLQIMADGFMPILEPIAEGISAVIGTGLWAAMQLALGAVNGLLDGVIIVLDGIGSVVSGMVDVVSGIFYGEWATVWQGFTEIASGAFDITTGLAQGLITSLIATLGNIIDYISGTFTGLWQSAWDNIQGIFSGVISSITGLFDGFINGITSGLDSLISKAASAVGITTQGHATGTSYFRGGLTKVNEHGGELMNLPSGTQIIPHDLSEKMVSEAVKPLMVEFAPRIAPTYEMEPRNVFTGGRERYLDTVGVANNTVVGGSSTTTNNETYNKNYNEPITINLTVQGNVIGNEDFMNQCGRYITDTLKTSLANM